MDDTANDDLNEIALTIASAIINMPRDVEVAHQYQIKGVDWAWHVGLDIAEHGPRSDMEQRILAHAMVRRLEGK